jgi:hypothetical protein
VYVHSREDIGKNGLDKFHSTALKTSIDPLLKFMLPSSLLGSFSLNRCHSSRDGERKIAKFHSERESR